MKKIILTKKLAILYKISIILGLTAFGLIFFLPLLFEEDVGYIVYCVLIAIGLMFGVIVFLYPFIFIDPNNVMSPKTKAEKYKVNVGSFEEFLKTTGNVLGEKGFSKIEERILEEYDIYLYASTLRHSNLELIQIIKAKELTDEILDNSSKMYIECVETHYNKKIDDLSEHITIMTIVCVNRINSPFRNIMNSNVEQDFETGRFIAGLSFGGKNLYIAEQAGGFGILKYKKYRKKFFELFDFLIEK